MIQFCLVQTYWISISCIWISYSCILIFIHLFNYEINVFVKKKICKKKVGERCPDFDVILLLDGHWNIWSGLWGLEICVFTFNFLLLFFICWSQNAASLVLLRSPMQRQSGSNIGNFQKIIDFQKIAFAMCNLQCQWRTLFSQIKQKPSTWFENPLWGEIWSRSFWRSQFFFLPWKLMSMSLPSWFFHKKGFFYF